MCNLEGYDPIAKQNEKAAKCIADTRMDKKHHPGLPCVTDSDCIDGVACSLGIC